ncbi:MAG: DNA polymerase I [bacterium]|nr:DNA polymerase I [bacterium]
MSGKKKNIWLIDGTAIMYRAYFAFIRNPLINKKGENTGAVYGFVNSILKIIREEEPDYIAVVFDSKHPTFRHERYEDYKSTRAKMPDDLAAQIHRVHASVSALGMQEFEMAGFEADDIVGTLAKSAERNGFEVWCVTGDKDYFQLVTDNVKVYTPKRVAETPERYGREEVKVKFGVYPEQVIDKLALMGDSSDNIPGIPGIGPKAADALLEQFKSLDDIYANLEQVKAKGVREKLAANKEKAYLSKELSTIHCEVPIEFDLEALKRKPINFDEAKKLFMELEFPSILQLLTPDVAAQSPTLFPEASQENLAYHLVRTIGDLENLVERLSTVKEFAVDTETDSINSLEANLVGVSLSSKFAEAWYLPIGHVEKTVNLPREKALPLIKKLLENPKVQKFGQNIKFDLQVFRRYGIEVNPVSFDTMLASYVVNPSERQHSLDYLAFKHFDFHKTPIKDLIGSGKTQSTFDKVPVEKACAYACEDADFTYRLRSIFAPLIDDLEMNNLYYNIELPLIKVLSDMEEAGVRIDPDFLGNLSKEMDKKLADLSKQIFKIAGLEFNINSTQQLSHILFEKLNLPSKGKTASGKGFSTDVRVLEELAKIHDFPRLILEYRSYGKLKSTYVDSLPTMISQVTGRVHTSYNQTIAATGRLSSTDPNLQNIPIRTDEGREIRRAFIARDKSYKILSADYSQIELRILAHYTEDPNLVDAFLKGQDIHARTAAAVFGVDLNEVTSAQRRIAKTTNFAIIYGVTAFGLSQQTDLTPQESQKFIDKYFEQYPGIRKYIDDTIAYARKTGYVTTLYNRRRYLPEINDSNRNIRQFAERTAINTPIQGTAADIIKVAMLKIHKALAGKKSKMILQVHDELVFDVHDSELEKVQKIVIDGMQNAAELKVPLIADVGIADNWLDAK